MAVKKSEKRSFFSRTAGGERLLLSFALNSRVTFQEVQALLGGEERRARSALKDLRELLGGNDSILYERRTGYFQLSPKKRVVDRVAAVLAGGFGSGDRLLAAVVGDSPLRKVVDFRGIDRGVRAKGALGSVSAKSIVTVLSAIASGESVEPQRPCWGWVGPVKPATVVDLGRYWAVRGYCHETKDWQFRPLVGHLNLVIRPSGEVVSAVKKSDDSLWHHTIDLKLAPHPRLVDARDKPLLGGLQRQQVYQQFFGDLPDTGSSRYAQDLSFDIQVSKALLHYFFSHWGIDTTARATRDPELYPLWLANRQVVYRSMRREIARGVKVW